MAAKPWTVKPSNTKPWSPANTIAATPPGVVHERVRHPSKPW